MKSIIPINTNVRKLFFLGGFMFSLTTITAQEKDLGTQEVNVVRSYTPVIRESNKIFETPEIKDSIVTSKKQLQYAIKSFPVASTFTPAKGKPSVLAKEPAETVYQNLVRLGLGNFNTAVAEVYSSTPLDRNANLDVILEHHSSQGGIDGVALDDRFFDTALEGGYRFRDRYMGWEASMKLSHQLYNWYGLSPEVIAAADLSSVNESHSYYSAVASGSVEFNESIFSGAGLELRHTWDSRSSSESRIKALPEFVLPDSDLNVRATLIVDYLKGNFKENLIALTDLPYSSLITGVTPRIAIQEGDLSLDLGGSLVYHYDAQNGDSDFFIYPQLTASLDMLDKLMVPYAGINGELQQTNYFDLVQQNPYLIPELDIRPTDLQYDAFAGIKGQLSSSLAYDLRAAYRVANNKALFRNAGVNPVELTGDYTLGNGYLLVYDQLKSLSLSAGMQLLLPEGLQLKAEVSVTDNDTKNEAEPWNLPSLAGALELDFPFATRWSAGAQLFYTGERQDLLSEGQGFNRVTLDGFVDINAKLSYQISQEWGAFLKLSNLTNNEYARWANYPVQGFQVMTGLSYQFDL